MNRWIVFIAVLALVGSGYLLMQNDDKAEIKSTAIKPQKVQKKVVKKDIQILYLDDEKKSENEEKDSQIATDTDNEYVKQTTKTSSSVDKEQVISQEQETSFVEGEKEAEKIIVEKGLQKVVSPSLNSAAKSKYSIYAKNSYDQIDEEKYRNLPPMMPTIITVTTPKGEKYSVVADSKIVQNNDKIYISKNDSSGKPETLLEVPVNKETSKDEATDEQTSEQNSQSDETIKLIAPPAIGQ